MLEVRKLSADHGQLRAVHELSLVLEPGQVHAVIGANGAGKSTLLRAIAGLHPPSSGSVLLDGEDITREPPEQRVTRGLCLVPEGRRLFSSLSVEENLLVGRHRAATGPWNLGKVYELFPWMRERRRQPATQLSGGEQQAVAIGRALVANPRMLLLDELSLGLSPKIVQQMYALMPRLLETGMAILLVEQDVSQAIRVASRLQCLLEGRTTLDGRPRDFTPAQIEAAYFGLREESE
ncbi:ABC transporter ATP-binding protein [Acrocarpospora macrocephala]|uniref:ABC transporter ATP-binding protein n=1 Tax=Acrocarpospora macrocephala TaxID=150177 RepID=A0A5M3WD23_9ACTN|nr:ABC transporter ATP-binding protein [Acrocarpospora macrocephala]GES06814.1 ABC transporter ATP-binding protein [Acrocarpospora macrocephala]